MVQIRQFYKRDTKSIRTNLALCRSKEKIYIYLTIHFLFADVFIFSSVFSLVMLLFAKHHKMKLLPLCCLFLAFRFLWKYIIPLQDNHR